MFRETSQKKGFAMQQTHQSSIIVGSSPRKKSNLKPKKEGKKRLENQKLVTCQQATTGQTTGESPQTFEFYGLCCTLFKVNLTQI